MLLYFCFYSFSGLHFHVVGEGVVRLRPPRQERVYDRENYIDFRMRLLGEPGKKYRTDGDRKFYIVFLLFHKPYLKEEKENIKFLL